MIIITLMLFILGLIVGSFLNVLSIRYNPEQGLFHRSSIGGRSHCVQCMRQLAWYELIPLVSFLVLCGKCRTCKLGISIQYPIVELLAGGIWLLPVLWFYEYHVDALLVAGQNIFWFYVWSATLVVALTILLLIAVIDLRTGYIPDEATIGVAMTGALHIAILTWYDRFDVIYGTFLGNFSMLFGLRDGVVTNHIIAGLIGLGLFMLIVLVTKGEGMGMGDVKLAGALGLMLGWPDIVVALMLSFFIGAFIGLILIAFKKRTIHGAIPFGPFMVLGTALTMLYGHAMVKWYLNIFGL